MCVYLSYTCINYGQVVYDTITLVVVKFIFRDHISFSTHVKEVYIEEHLLKKKEKWFHLTILALGGDPIVY